MLASGKIEAVWAVAKARKAVEMMRHIFIPGI